MIMYKFHPDIVEHLIAAGWDIVRYDDTVIETSKGNIYEIQPDGNIKKSQLITDDSSDPNSLKVQLTRLSYCASVRELDRDLSKYIYDKF